MKKIIVTLLISAIFLTLTACGNESGTKEESYNGLSYKYSDKAVRSESEYGIEYDYGNVKESDANGFIITVNYKEYDPAIYESGADMLTDWMIQISGNEEYYNLEDGSIVIDGNKALTYKYSLTPDSPVTCESIFLLRGDKVLNISAYGITNEDCAKELDSIITSMHIE